MTHEAYFEKYGSQFLDYDPETGVFVFRAPDARHFSNLHRCNNWIAINAGKVAGGTNKQGYVRLQIRGHKVPAHRYAWFCVHGYWPEVVDHINGNPSDNRISNLRDVDESLNRMNQRQRSDNTSGVTGVCFSKSKRRWVAQICVRGVRRNLGHFHTKDEAVEIRLTAQRLLGFGPMHGVRS